jgi:putative transposase
VAARGPFDGIPKLVRVDRGAGFLSRTVAQAMGALAVRHVELPPRRPDLKPYVESLNTAFKDMHFRGMPGYTHCPDPDPDPDPAAKPKLPSRDSLLTFG